MSSTDTLRFRSTRLEWRGRRFCFGIWWRHLALALNGTAGIRDQNWGQPSTPPGPAAKHPIHKPTLPPR